MFCPSCASPLQPGQQFCPICGRATATQPQPPPIAPYGQFAANDKPSSVRMAAGLIFISIAISLLAMARTVTLVGFGRFVSIPNLVLPLFLMVLWVIFAISALQRQNWARIGAAILVVFGVLLIVTTVRILSRGVVPYFALALPWLVFLLRIGAVYLLFTPDSNAWFSGSAPPQAVGNSR